jgi:hypothetical protein
MRRCWGRPCQPRPIGASVDQRQARYTRPVLLPHRAREPSPATFVSVRTRSPQATSAADAGRARTSASATLSRSSSRSGTAVGVGLVGPQGRPPPRRPQAVRPHWATIRHPLRPDASWQTPTPTATDEHTHSERLPPCPAARSSAAGQAPQGRSASLTRSASG